MDEMAKTFAERLFGSEDSFTERKPQGASERELRRTIVAFANTAPPDRPGLLLIGVANDGMILGVDNTEKLQKKVREVCEDQCYPPIAFGSQVLNRDGKSVLAISVFRSQRAPHFAGHAYSRVGAENRNTSEETLRDLIAARTEVGRILLQHVGSEISVKVVDKKLGADSGIGTRHGAAHACTLLEVTPHYVHLRDEKTREAFVEDLAGIRISRDLKLGRLRIVIRPIGQTA